MKTAGTGPRLAARARSLEVSPTVAMAAKARALKAKGVRVFDFTVGEPDQPTPRHVLEARQGGDRRRPHEVRARLGPARAARGGRRTATARTSRSPSRPRRSRSPSAASRRSRSSTRPSSTAAARSSSRSRRGRRSPRRRAWPAARPVFVPLTREERLPRHRARGGEGDHAEDARRRREQPLEPDRAPSIEPEELLKIARLAKKHGFWLLYDDTYAHLVFRHRRAARAPGGEGRRRRPPRGRGDGVEDATA